METISAPVRHAYLAGLGLEAEPPSVAALFRIHRAHVERVPYENLWIHLGERWTIDIDQSAARIATGRRGGYCFHLNGALSGLLHTLGYDVTLHVGGVHGPSGVTESELANHVVLTISGLPTEANPEGTWYVDAGLGDALHEPLPLLAGAYDQGPFHLVLSESAGGTCGWHLAHDPAGGFAGMTWRSAPTGMDTFIERHARLSSSPESVFVKVLTVQRRDASGADVLRGLTLKRIGDRAVNATLTSRREFEGALGDLFGLDLGSIGHDGREHLWAKVRAAHQAWEAAGRP